MRDSLCDKLADQMSDTYIKSPTFSAGSPQISKSRMRDWVAEVEEVAAIVLVLKLDGSHAVRFQQLADAFRGLISVVPSSVGSAVRMLAEVKQVLGDAKKIEKCVSLAANDFATSLRNLPGDALYLNEVSPEHTEGYVAYLRRIVEVADESVTLTQSRMSSSARYLRISSLRSPYVYAMSQQFASVFSAIGLPVEYEDARDFTLEKLRQLEAYE
jgi:hypothetical protein